MTIQLTVKNVMMSLKKMRFSRAWWHTPANPLLWRGRKEDHKFKANLDSLGSTRPP